MAAITNECLTVADYYEGKSVFITGVTGFLGKMFQRLKSSRPEDLNKIVSMAGDLTAAGLGLDDKDEALLLQNVSVVFHAAATVNFNEPIRVAVGINLEGTIKVLDLCKRMLNIRVLVYLSTAYSNSDKQVVEERVYPFANIHDLYKFIEQYGDDEEATKSLLNGRPNTYSFTKFLTEAYLAEYHGDVATVILRPSIVVPATSEPMEGWVDAWQSNTVGLATAARGFHRVLTCDPHCVVDLIPVDYVINMAIVAAVHSKKGEVSVYNCCTSEVNPITWGTMYKLFLKASKADHFHKVPFPRVVLTCSRVEYAVLALLTQIVPAYLMDAWRIVTRQRTKYIRVKRQLTKLRDHTTYFTTRSWVMRSERACALAAALTGVDASSFPCHPANVYWPSYMPVYYMGVKRYLFGEK